MKVYSFSGNSESISVSNGVIVLSGKDEICYGGNLKVMSDDFADITAYSTTIYVDGEEDSILLSHAVADQTGGTIDVSGNIGKISGDVLRDGDADKLFYPQIGVKPCSMAGGGVSKNIWNCFRTAPEGTGQPLTCSTSGMGLRLK